MLAQLPEMGKRLKIFSLDALVQYRLGSDFRDLARPRLFIEKERQLSGETDIGY